MENTHTPHAPEATPNVGVASGVIDSRGPLLARLMFWDGPWRPVFPTAVLPLCFSASLAELPARSVAGVAALAAQSGRQPALASAAHVFGVAQSAESALAAAFGRATPAVGGGRLGDEASARLRFAAAELVGADFGCPAAPAQCWIAVTVPDEIPPATLSQRVRCTQPAEGVSGGDGGWSGHRGHQA